MVTENKKDVNVAPQENVGILSNLYQKLVVLNIETGEEIAVITHGDTPVDTIADHIVVKLTPVYD